MVEIAPGDNLAAVAREEGATMGLEPAQVAELERFLEERLRGDAEFQRIPHRSGPRLDGGVGGI